jgi:hypothetical protein
MQKGNIDLSSHHRYLWHSLPNLLLTHAYCIKASAYATPAILDHVVRDSASLGPTARDAKGNATVALMVKFAIQYWAAAQRRAIRTVVRPVSVN